MSILQELVLFEQSASSIEIDGFKLTQEPEYEDDNVKIWHRVVTPGGQQVTLDHSPYENISDEAFKQYIAFYKQNGRFPSREDIKSIGPLHREDLISLT